MNGFDYGCYATETTNMLTFVIDGVSHQAWFDGSWHDVSTRCEIRKVVATAHKLRCAETQPITCMLCLNAITETEEYNTRQARAAFRRGRRA